MSKFDTAYTQEVTCPWCGHVGHDSWEYESDEFEVECGECGREFVAWRNIEVTYGSKRPECKDGKHKWGKAWSIDIDQETADRWNKKRLCGRADYVPHRTWRVECQVCEYEEYRGDLPPGAECPANFPPTEKGGVA